MQLPPSLLTTIAASGARVRVGYPWWLRPFLMRGVIAITLGRRIYVMEGKVTMGMERLLRHELAHVRQVREHGVIGFYWRYLVEFGRRWWRLRNVQAAYEGISFEVEARAAEDL